MKYLLTLEWKKVKNYRPFVVMSILYIILLPSTLLLLKTFPEAIFTSFGGNSIYSFPTGWKYLGYAGNWIGYFFLGFMAVLMVSSEFGNKTLRQNIITGLSRKEYFAAKVLFMAALSLAATAYYFLIGCLFGVTHSVALYGDVFVQNLDYIPRFFLMTFGYMSLGLFLGTWVRRTGIAIFLYLAYGIFLEQILRGLHVYFMEKFGMDIENGGTGIRSFLFYPVNALEDLTPIPFPKMAEEMMNEMPFNPFLSPGEATTTAIFYTSIFLFFTYRLLTKRDL